LVDDDVRGERRLGSTTTVLIVIVPRRLDGVVSVELAQKSVPGVQDVFAGKSPGEGEVTGGHRVEDALVLLGDIRRPDELVRLHLADAEFDLTHQQAVHLGETRAALRKNELTMEVNIAAGEG